MGNLGLNMLLGGYYGTAMVGRHYAGSCQAARQDDAAQVKASEEANGTWTPPEESVSEPTPVAQSVEERFESRLENRFRKPDNPDGAGQAAAKAERLKDAAIEIGGALGQAKANEFMNKILYAVNDDKGVGDGETSADLAAKSFFETLSGAALEDPEIYQKLEDVKKSLAEAETGEAEEASPKAAAETGALVISEAQGRLYQNYTKGRNPVAEKGAFQIARSLGNLVNSFI